MSDAIDPARFAPPLSFMGVRCGHDLGRAAAAIVGLPFDVGTDPHRVGARHGPRAIRIESGRIGPHAAPELDIDVPAALGLIDCGDVRLVPSELEAAHAAIEAAIAPIATAGVVPYTMGGDGTVTLGQLRALARTHRDLVVLHVDAHTDAVSGDSRAAATGTSFRHAAEERLVDVAHSMHVGVRGPHEGAGLDIVAVDVNTVSPPHDPGGVTAMLAARVLFACMVLQCRRLPAHAR